MTLSSVRSLQEFHRICLRHEDTFAKSLILLGFNSKEISEIFKNSLIQPNAATTDDIIRRYKRIEEICEGIDAFQLRKICSNLPRLLLSNNGPMCVLQAKIILVDTLNFDKQDCFNILQKAPRICASRISSKCILENHKLLTTQEFTKQEIASIPFALQLSQGELQNRIEFLKSHSKAQFNKSKPNFISLETLGKEKRKDFLEAIGNQEAADFCDFLKTQ